MLSFLATIALAALPACGPIDLDTALALAGSRSDEMAIKRSEVAAAKADLAIAKAARWIPDASATVTTGLSPEARGVFPNQDVQGSSRGLTGVGVFGRIDVNVLQPLYTFGRLSAARDAADAGVKARTLQVEDTLSQVELRVRRLFWGEALARKLLSIAGDVEKALLDAEKRVNDLLKKNDPSIAPSDRYRIDVFKGVLRGRQAEARKGLELAHVGLAATLATSPHRLQVQQVALALEEGEPPDAGAARQAAERRRPDLLALDQAILAKQADVRAQEAAYKPQFFILGNVSYGRATNRDIQTNPWAYDPIDIYTFGAVLGFRQDLAFPLLTSRAEKARAELATLEQQRVGLARLVNTQVDSAVAEVTAARERLAAASAARDAGRALFRSSSLDFAVGLLEARVLLEAYAVYIENQVGLATAAYDVLVARAQLGQVTGENPKIGAPTCELF